MTGISGKFWKMESNENWFFEILSTKKTNNPPKTSYQQKVYRKI